MRFEVEIEEKVIYRHTVIVEADCVSKVDDAVDVIEGEANHPDEIPSCFEQEGIKVIEYNQDSDGDSCEFECCVIEKLPDESEADQ